MLGSVGSQDSRPILGSSLSLTRSFNNSRLFPGSRKSSPSGISRRTIGIWKKKSLCPRSGSSPFRASEVKYWGCIRSETGTNDLANPKLYSTAENYAAGCRCVLFTIVFARCPDPLSRVSKVHRRSVLSSIGVLVAHNLRSHRFPPNRGGADNSIHWRAG